MADLLRVTVPNDPIQLELVQGAAALPIGGKNLVHVSQMDGKLQIRIFDADSRMVVDADESRIPANRRPEIDELKKRLANLWPPRNLNGNEKTEIINKATAIVGYNPNTQQALFTPLPQTGKLFLRTNTPKAPTTEDSLNRVNFQLQQIQFNQLRLSNPSP